MMTEDEITDKAYKNQLKRIIDTITKEIIPKQEATFEYVTSKYGVGYARILNRDTDMVHIVNLMDESVNDESLKYLFLNFSEFLKKEIEKINFTLWY